MRMCETGRATWLLGSHEGDWSYKPLITRQYLLRSKDQGRVLGIDTRSSTWRLARLAVWPDG